MTKTAMVAIAVLAAGLAACGGNEPRQINCEANLKYQNRVEGKRVVAPEGLDPLNELQEMPVPRADPDAPQMPPGICNDAPPSIRSSD